MRPEILSLVCLVMYPDLVDHPSVLDYPSVKEIKSSVYLIDYSEQAVIFCDSSKQTLHEAKFLVLLARHLLHKNNGCNRYHYWLSQNREQSIRGSFKS